MSQFNTLSRKIGATVHRATKEANGTADERHVQVMANEEVMDAVKDLVNYTLKMTEDNQ